MRDRTTEKKPREEQDLDLQADTPAPATESPLLTLQRQAGNAAVVAMLREQTIQPKLQVGAVDDPAEREADRLADQVMSEIDAAPVRRKAAAGPASTSPGHGLEGGPVDNDVATDIERARGGGKPLDESTRTQMEGAFGTDFSGIRVHTDSKADTLSRSLNAQAFTTGSDIFFSAGQVDKRVLAHELAHTVQQGAAPVRRFMAVPQFEKLTYESTFSMKSSAQNAIIKMLEEYTKLFPNAKDKKKPGTVPPDKAAHATALVTNMKAAAQTYIDAKQDDKGKKENRFAGFQSFINACDVELLNLSQAQANATKKGVDQKAYTVDNAGLVKLMQHYKGSLSTSMERAAVIVAQLAPNNGDSGEFTMELDIPVSPGVFVGASFKFEAKKGDVDAAPPPTGGKTSAIDNSKQGNTEVGCEVAFKAGGDVIFGKLQGAIGGYMKASAKTPESAMKLLSYALYRRCKESSVIPSELSSKLWGGTADDAGKKKAEDWSLAVEQEEFSEEGNFAETGGTASLKGKGDVGVASISAEAKATAGKRYDKQSMDKTKQGAGKKNTKGENWFAQETTGRSVESIELNAAVEAGVGDAKFGGDCKLVLTFRSAGGKGAKSEYVGMEFEARGRGTVPAAGFEAKLISTIVDFIGNLKKLQSGQIQKASTLSNVKDGVTAAYQISDTTVQGLEGMPIADIVKKNTLDRLLTPTTSEGAPDPMAPTKDSAVGLELAYNYATEGTDSQASFELRHLTSSGFKIPSLLEAQLLRRKRIVGGRNKNAAGWSFTY